MKKEILLEKAFMRANPYLAIFFSMVEVNPSTISWLIKFFTSPSACTKGQNEEFDMCDHSIVSKLYLNKFFLTNCPFVEVCNIDQSLLSGGIIDVIKNAIMNGYCMAAVINPHFIKAYGDFGLSEHDLLISGFDDDKKVVLGNDFFPPYNKYEQRQITYKEYENAFDRRNRKYNIRFLKKKEIVTEPDIENLREVLLESLSNLMEEHLQMENPYYAVAYRIGRDTLGEYVEKKKVWTGIGVYDGMIQNIDNIQYKYWIMLIDIHRLISYALSLLLPDSEYTIMFMGIEKELEIVLNLGIKHRLSGKQEILNNMVEILKKIKEKESICIVHLLEQLSNGWQCHMYETKNFSSKYIS